MRSKTKYTAVVTAVSISMMLCMRQSEASPVIPVPAFSGNHVETWEGFPNNSLSGPADIMGGAASITNDLPLMYVYDTTGSTFGLQLGVSTGVAGTHDGTKGMGINDYPDVTTTTIIFDSPVNSFGAYWAASGDTGSLATVTLSFYDANDDLLGTSVSFDYLFSSGGALVWHGWAAAPLESIKTVTYQGSGIAVDSLQALEEAAPEPATLIMFVIGASGMIGYALCSRRRKKLNSAN